VQLRTTAKVRTVDDAFFLVDTSGNQRAYKPTMQSSNIHALPPSYHKKEGGNSS